MAQTATTLIPAFVDSLQARGRYTFTRDEALTGAGREAPTVDAALRRLRRRGRLASPRRGFYVVVPVEYRSAGCPPATWFIDALMGFLGQPYYVALLTAAGLHGAAHQQPMLFQVITDRPTRGAGAGRVRIAFHMSRSVGVVPVVRLPTETGVIPVSTPEGTALDLVRFASAAGHLGNVATVLRDLAEKIDGRALASVARWFGTPDLQRLGYLLDRIGRSELAEALRGALHGRRLRSVLLSPGARRRSGALDERWRLVANVEVELDS
jgi:predicted transcriptional regulator of viral defense system